MTTARSRKVVTLTLSPAGRRALEELAAALDLPMSRVVELMAIQVNDERKVRR